jgi:hypothetical protein
MFSMVNTKPHAGRKRKELQAPALQANTRLTRQKPKVCYQMSIRNLSYRHRPPWPLHLEQSYSIACSQFLWEAQKRDPMSRCMN